MQQACPVTNACCVKPALCPSSNPSQHKTTGHNKSPFCPASTPQSRQAKLAYDLIHLLQHLPHVRIHHNLVAPATGVVLALALAAQTSHDIRMRFIHQICILIRLANLLQQAQIRAYTKRAKAKRRSPPATAPGARVRLPAAFASRCCPRCTW